MWPDLSFKLTWRNVLVAAVLAVVIVLVITNLRSGHSTGDGTVVMGYVPMPTPTPAPLAVVMADVVDPELPGGSSPLSTIVMVQGMVDRRLVVWPLNHSEPPQEVDAHVALWPLLPSPDGGHVLYRTPRALLVLDVQARRSAIVGELPEDASIWAVQWSPDSRAIAYVIQTDTERASYFTRYNGDQPAERMLGVPRGLSLDVGWLPPARPVTISMSIGDLGGLEARYHLFDPDTGDWLPLPDNTPVEQPTSPWRSQDGVYQLYSTPEWPYAPRQGYCTISRLAVTSGSEWLLLAAMGRGKPHDIAFEVDDVFLDSIHWLADGRVLFRGTTDESCGSTGSGLYLARLGDTELAPFVSSTPAILIKDGSDLLVSDLAYAVSPDESLVAWSQNDRSTQRGMIYLTPLAGDEPTTTLFETSPPEEPFDFEDGQVILQFVWLP